jgi:2-polyprenyl-3-methyl-5-hydroxy-6-metoxy-1,4-benzoquinol methylase
VNGYDARYREWAARQGPAVGDLGWRLAHLPWRQRMLLSRYPVRGRRVLDYGCGDGVFAAALALHGARVVGYDISPAAISQAAHFQALTPGMEATAIEPAEGGFELVFCTEVLEHAEDDRAFAARVMARACSGGLLVGTTPVGRAFWDPDHKHVYDENGLRAVLAPLGRVTIRRRYRTRLRNLLPWPQGGAAVFLFEVVRPG